MDSLQISPLLWSKFKWINFKFSWYYQENLKLIHLNFSWFFLVCKLYKSGLYILIFWTSAVFYLRVFSI